MNFEKLVQKAKKEYYSIFRGEPPAILIGSATCGISAGSNEIKKVIEDEITRENIEARIIPVGCIGSCYAEPLIGIFKDNKEGIFYGPVNKKIVKEIIKKNIIEDEVAEENILGTIQVKETGNTGSFFESDFMRLQSRQILRRCGLINPEDINHYLATGGYTGLLKALEMGADEIIDTIKRSGLRGRGGAGFPTWLKWDLCRQSNSKEKYIICNADEGDPGAFMNRSLLEGDPHSVIEGILIGAHTIKAKKAYIYCRAEYPAALEKLEKAIKDLDKIGLLDIEIVIKRGAGAFVCGEETALIASIEGRRGMPRTRPPFPTTKGLWGKPTVINNVETFAAVSLIFQEGVEQFSSIGTGSSKGTKTFSLVGDVKRTGLIEVPLGTTLKRVIFDIGGGIKNGGNLKAVQIGGPSGGCLPASMMDTEIDYDSLTSAGAIMGSGGLVVLSDDSCMVEIARYFLEFTQRESCGKCVPCRLGTQQMLLILNDIVQGNGSPEDIETLHEVAEAVKAASLCGLGQTAPNPVLTTLKYFREEYVEHVMNGRCPAAYCRELMHYFIDEKLCTGCMVCSKVCPADAIVGLEDEVHFIDQEKCLKCGSCMDVCKEGAILKVPGPGKSIE
ncbi:NADH-quinone oxidoreductase subunit NuoF [Methanothermobacter tenebrarum]|uniref:NADH-quinone oxidoreductase subunit F n=1 Tax=Methanothermobacter tenebrarum TaxID=680118 RepID=A0A328PDW7_9EURY|nr:NADH-quinone oxidoreductase subunit NuoF [Methanothermobacter tenebrarum]NPV65450.1 NADH-quinone oxidoreductase subunit NuoF [Methanobacteriaceae archaeon]RAO78522.1 NADH-quinone oxidoreductase subunit F [Methanothermobacter tenebrarum]